MTTEAKVSSGALIARATDDLRRAARPVLVFHALIQLLGLALFLPLIAWCGRRIVFASGQLVISNFDIAAFVLSPAGALFVLVSAALTLGVMLAEFAGHAWISARTLQRRPASAFGALWFVLQRLPALTALGTRLFLRLLLLALPLVAVLALLWWSTLRGHDINYYLAEHPPQWRRAMLIAAVLGAVYAVLAVRQLLAWIYALPRLLFAGDRPRAALAGSSALTHGALLRIARPLLVWWLLITLSAALVAVLFRMPAGWLLDWAGLDFSRVLPVLAVLAALTVIFAWLVGALQIAGHQFIVMRAWLEADPNAAVLLAEREIDDAQPRPGAAWRWGLAVAALVLLGAGALLLRGLQLRPAAAITAHRGASVDAPENTLAALRRAIDAGADWAEIDVQHTRDGEIVLLHDGDLMRMAGDARRIGELTVADLAGIDVGRSFSAEFTGEHVPTLRDAIELSRGKLRLNVELKYNVPDTALAPAVVALLRELQFADQSSITSLDYAALLEVERLAPELPTGHIVTAAVGDVTRGATDFLSLNVARASPALVRRAHAAGKQVHVWTVNDPEAMLRALELGVDNVITDYPVVLRGLLEQRSAMSRSQQLGLRLRVLFNAAPRELTTPEAVAPL